MASKKGHPGHPPRVTFFVNETLRYKRKEAGEYEY